MHFSDDGSLDLRKLTVKCVQNAKLNKKRDFLLNYLRKHLAVLQSIQNNYGLKHPKTNVRKTVESQNLEISTENDCLEDPFCIQGTPDPLHPEAEHAFKAKDLKHRKQLIGTLSINMHSIGGRIAQSDFQQKLAENIAQKYPDKMTNCKIGCGLKHPKG